MAYSPEIEPTEKDPLKDVESKKMTKTRLAELLRSLNLQYAINGEGNDFEIVIDLPEAHIIEKKARQNGPFFNDVESLRTEFEIEKIHPLIRALKRSNNLDCNLKFGSAQYRVEVSKKQS